MEEPPVIIGERLRALREEKKLSQGDIEKRTGLIRCYVSGVENGHTVPAVETLEKFARALEVPMYQLFYEGEEPPSLPNLAIPKKATISQETHAASPDEVLAILETREKAGEKKARAAVALMFFAGLRPGEARGVRWEDFDGKRLVVRQSIWHTYTTSPKTTGSAKPVPVIEPLGSILADLHETCGNPTSGPILRGPSGKPLDLHNLANRVVIPALKRCAVCKQSESNHDKADHDYRLDESLPKWHGWYALRRGVGTAIADLSNSLAAKGLLRHSSVSTTERHYIKDVPESTLQAMKMLETLCNPCATSGEGKPI
jgi:transcriptional regulator with XRE-family HTH domain